MKNTLLPLLCLGLIGFGFLCSPMQTARAQGTAFSYQGHLTDNGAPANGSYELEFYLRDAQFGATPVGVTNDLTPVVVSNGLFSITLDFGAVVFPGADRWLELGVRTNGSSGDFDILSPRQKILPVPYALHTLQADSAAALSASALNQPLVINVNNNRALRLEPTLYGFPNFIIGSIDNSVSAGGMGDTIAGGDANSIDVIGQFVTANYSFVGGGYQNHIQNSDLSLVAGGDENIISNAPEGAVSGGEGNQIKGDPDTGGPSTASLIAGGQNNRIFHASYSAIGGGAGNRITNATEVFIGGGAANVIGGSTFGDAIAGGDNNTILVGDDTVIGGGYLNQIGDGHANSGYATIPGGYGNLALGEFSFAAGLYAQATNLGSFVWSDGAAAQFDRFASVVNNEFAVRARGGVRFVTGGAGLYVDGLPVAAGGTVSNGSVTAAKLSAANPAAGQVLALGADGTTLVWTNAAVSSGGGWSLTGNSGITPGVNYLGTADNQSLEFRANNIPALRLTPINYTKTVSGKSQIILSANVVAGYSGNYIPTNVGGATISGGGGSATTVTGSSVKTTISTNLAAANWATVGGGTDNRAFGISSTVGGGEGNTADFTSGTVAGGIGNEVDGEASTIGGGEANLVYNDFSVIGGGSANTIDAGDYATVGGGSQNAGYGNFTVVAGGLDNTALGIKSMVAGGDLNLAGGIGSFAAGHRAQATNDGAFVWADSVDDDFGSTATNQFAVRANGGAVIQGGGDFGHPQLQLTQTTNDFARLRLNNPSNSWDIAAGTDSSLRFYSHGADQMILNASGLTVNGTFVSSSDRNVKENFKGINPTSVLEKVAAMPISQWNYKQDKTSEHIGPMAQDFYAAFNVGPDDKHIAMVDEGGVALAAIQGLNQKLNEKDVEIQDLKQSVAELKALVQTLAQKK